MELERHFFDSFEMILGEVSQVHGLAGVVG
jgi:hypothetical protein